MQVVWLKRAHRSLQYIADYIAQDNPAKAYEFINKLYNATAILSEHPEIGRLGRVEGTRELAIDKNYIIPYSIKGKEVQILHIFHSARKWPDGF